MVRLALVVRGLSVRYLRVLLSALVVQYRRRLSIPGFPGFPGFSLPLASSPVAPLAPVSGYIPAANHLILSYYTASRRLLYQNSPTFATIFVFFAFLFDFARNVDKMLIKKPQKIS
jgi:hypothetical protein